MSTKIDPRKNLGKLYAPSAKEPSLFVAPRLQILAMEGAGDPNNSPAWQSAAETLYSLSYTLKFALKKEGFDYGVMPLEAFWWVADGGVYDPSAPRANWRWRAFIVQPDFVTAAHVEAAQQAVAAKKPSARPQDVRFDAIEEGLVAQLMHIGPYSAEWPNIERLHKFVADQGYRLRGDHHEVYLSDPNRTEPARMKTILRHAVEATVSDGSAT
jgi:hypothetical protein